MALTVALIDYGAGNLRSAAKSLERAADDRGLTANVQLVTDADAVAKADYIVLPGVGAFEHCKTSLSNVPGMIDALKDAVFTRKTPFLGICVGMQLMAERGTEHGTTPGLGWIPGSCDQLTPTDPTLKIPHMGWNELTLVNNGQSHPVFKNLSNGAHVYFVHSYHVTETEEVANDVIVATTDYGGPVTAAIAKDNFVGVQFHPEKSQRAGLELLGNFLTWKP